MKKGGPKRGRVPNKKTVPPKPGWYGQKKISQFLRVNYQTLQTAIRGGLAVREDGKIELAVAKKWFQDKADAKTDTAELKRQKLQTEIDRNLAAAKRTNLELAAMRGELHSKKDCCASLGQLLVTVWMEFAALPARGQSAHPEIQGLEKTLTDLINPISDKLQGFAKQHAGKELVAK